MHLQLKRDPAVEPVFNNYPAGVRSQMLCLRELILKTASELDQIDSLEETLKWGEPSYLAKKGSTIRIDWKAKAPDQYAIYFKCTSRLIPTFKAVFGNSLKYEGDRAIVFQLDESLPEDALKSCIAVALTYHRVKHLPLLGM